MAENLSGAVDPVKTVTPEEISQTFLDNFGIVGWGEAGTEAVDAIDVQLQMGAPSPGGDDVALAREEILRLTCSAGTMSAGDGAAGTVLSGDGTDDMIIKCDASGHFDLKVTYDGTGDVTVLAGATQGSRVVGCSESKVLTFA